MRRRAAKHGTSYGKVTGDTCSHPSLVIVSDAAFRAFFAIVSWCSIWDTAGELPESVLKKCIGGSRRRVERIKAELLHDSGRLWQPPLIERCGERSYRVNALVVRFGRDGHDWDRAETYKVLERDGLRCRYCQCDLDASDLTFDHVIPRSRGGSDKPGNLVVCCGRCNSRKSDRTPDEAGMVLN